MKSTQLCQADIPWVSEPVTKIFRTTQPLFVLRCDLRDCPKLSVSSVPGTLHHVHTAFALLSYSLCPQSCSDHLPCPHQPSAVLKLLTVYPAFRSVCMTGLMVLWCIHICCTVRRAGSADPTSVSHYQYYCCPFLSPQFSRGIKFLVPLAPLGPTCLPVYTPGPYLITLCDLLVAYLCTLEASYAGYQLPGMLPCRVSPSLPLAGSSCD